MRDAHGKFLPGPDPARHRLTRAERRKGYRAARRKLATTRDPVDGPSWLDWRVKLWYCGRVLLGG